MAHSERVEHARQIAAMPPSRERDAIMAYLNGSSLSSIRDRLGFPDKDAVRELIKPHRRFRCWRERATPEDHDAISEALNSAVVATAGIPPPEPAE